MDLGRGGAAEAAPFQSGGMLAICLKAYPDTKSAGLVTGRDCEDQRQVKSESKAADKADKSVRSTRAFY
jgi:hypothetical protein